VIDEISMIDAELFQKLDMIAQRVRDNIRPFGGLQLVLSGDFFQLPPVSAGGCKFAFESEAWDRAVDAIVELKRVMRQGDEVFVRILNEIRWGNLTAASYGKLLECQRKAPASRTSDGVQDTKLHPYNVNVRAENEKRLQQLQGEAHVFVAEDCVLDANGKRLQPVKPGKPSSSAPRQDTLVARLDNLNVDRTIALKVGSLESALFLLFILAEQCSGMHGLSSRRACARDTWSCHD
jgi:ATP-dependent DNA helicase PIF1